MRTEQQQQVTKPTAREMTSKAIYSVLQPRRILRDAREEQRARAYRKAAAEVQNAVAIEATDNTGT